MYQTFAWNETFAMASLAVGVLLAVALLGWTCLSFYRRQSRAFVGLLACGFCFWQLLVIPGFMHAVKIRRDEQRPKTGAVDGEIPLLLTIEHARPTSSSVAERRVQPEL